MVEHVSSKPVDSTGSEDPKSIKEQIRNAKSNRRRAIGGLAWDATVPVAGLALFLPVSVPVLTGIVIYMVTRYADGLPSQVQRHADQLGEANREIQRLKRRSLQQ